LSLKFIYFFGELFKNLLSVRLLLSGFIIVIIRSSLTILLCLLFLLLFALFFLLIFELLRIQNNWLVLFKKIDEWAGENMLIQELKFLSFSQCKHHVLRFQIGVDDATDSVHVVETQEHLLAHPPHNW
jgi:hypothetical protein